MSDAVVELHRAAHDGDVAKLSAILNADPQIVHAMPKGSYSALIGAVIAGQEPAARYLLLKGSDPNRHAPAWVCSSLLPLVMYAHKYHDPVPLATAILDAGADIDIQDDKGTTPLHIAAYKGNLALAKLFIMSGASTSLKDKKQRTPMDVAKEYNHPQIIELLRDSRPLRSKLL